MQRQEDELDYADLFYKVRHHSDLLWPQYLRGELDRWRRRGCCGWSGLLPNIGMKLEPGTGGSEFRPPTSVVSITIEMLDGVRGAASKIHCGGHVVGVITNGPAASPDEKADWTGYRSASFQRTDDFYL
jgi:hypothetical protein